MFVFWNNGVNIRSGYYMFFIYISKKERKEKKGNYKKIDKLLMIFFLSLIILVEYLFGFF